jgi:hypothetical protein
MRIKRPEQHVRLADHLISRKHPATCGTSGCWPSSHPRRHSSWRARCTGSCRPLTAALALPADALSGERVSVALSDHGELRHRTGRTRCENERAGTQALVAASRGRRCGVPRAELCVEFGRATTTFCVRLPLPPDRLAPAVRDRCNLACCYIHFKRQPWLRTCRFRREIPFARPNPGSVADWQLARAVAATESEEDPRTNRGEVATGGRLHQAQERSP